MERCYELSLGTIERMYANSSKDPKKYGYRYLGNQWIYLTLFQRAWHLNKPKEGILVIKNIFFKVGFPTAQQWWFCYAVCEIRQTLIAHGKSTTNCNILLSPSFIFISYYYYCFKTFSSTHYTSLLCKIQASKEPPFFRNLGFAKHACVIVCWKILIIVEMAHFSST